MAAAAARASYRSVVIGAGPAGVSAVANLLDANVHPVLWVDPAFAAGRLARYPRVPSNTKVQLFVDFAMASPTLARIVDTVSPPPLGELKSMDPQGNCLLKHTVRLISQLTDGIKHKFADKVDFFQGWATRVARKDHNSKPTWSVALGEQPESLDVVSEVDTENVIFATGSHPISAHPSWAPHLIYNAAGRHNIEELSLETALDPVELASSVSPDDVVAVVGGSHSGILCLKNLAELPNRPRKIVHYYRQELKYAVYMDGWILYDNTGLKGDAAAWAKQKLETGSIPNLESYFLKDPETEADIYKSSMGEVTKIIYAIGFRRNNLPKLLIESPGAPEVKQDRVKHRNSGKIVVDDEPVAGLWGYGIAFPEETVDPYGNKELAVGLWKFMRYMKRAIHQEVVPEVEKNGLSSSNLRAHL